MNLLLRLGRKARHLIDTHLVERLLADRVTPAVAPRLFRPRRRPVPDPASVRRVLVWNVDSPGDLLWTTPTLRALRAGYPHAEITLACNRACAELADTNPNVNRVVGLPAAHFDTGRGVFARPRELAGPPFDVMLILEMGARPADAARVLARRLGVGYTVSTNLGLLKTLPDFTLSANTDCYWAQHFLAAVAHLGLTVPDAPPKLEVHLTAADEDAAAAVLGGDRSARTVALHPQVASYARRTKKWPDESFVELARLLTASAATRFVLTGSSDERADCDALAARITATTGAVAVAAAGRLSLRGTAALYRRAGVVVVADTAALHLAAAADAPTVALFGCTDSRLIAPHSPRVLVLNERLPCSPCLRYSDQPRGWPACRFSRQECMYAITPAAVASAAERLLTEGERR